MPSARTCTVSPVAIGYPLNSAGMSPRSSAVRGLRRVRAAATRFTPRRMSCTTRAGSHFCDKPSQVPLAPRTPWSQRTSSQCTVKVAVDADSSGLLNWHARALRHGQCKCSLQPGLSSLCSQRAPTNVFTQLQGWRMCVRESFVKRGRVAAFHRTDDGERVQPV